MQDIYVSSMVSARTTAPRIPDVGIVAKLDMRNSVKAIIRNVSTVKKTTSMEANCS